jgi:uncharacterized protein HemY
MDKAAVKKWAIFFAGILCAILIGDTLSNVLVNLAGLSGSVGFIVNFVLYAVIFFSVLYVLEKLFHIEFFGFNQ